MLDIEIKTLQDKLEESEKKFKLLFEKAPLAYQSLDIDGNILDVNDKWVQILGYSREEVIGKNMGDFLTKQWKTHFKNNFKKFKDLGEILGTEFEIITKNGNPVTVCVQGRIGNENDGTFRQTHCIFVDITKERQSEERTKQLEKDLIKSKKSEAIGRFAREIIHDLNNILTPLLFSSQMLELNMKKTDPNYEWLNRIKNSIDRANELIAEINSFSETTPKDSYQSFYIQPIIEEVLDLLNFPSNIKLVKYIDKFDYTFCGLSIKVHQIIMNLITNAIHSIDIKKQGLIIIKFKLIDVEKNNSYIPNAPEGVYSCLTIIDNGCGMTQDTIDKIFEPFFTTRSNGTGLGMAVVESLLKSMNSFICIDSDVGIGTKIRVYFPMIKVIFPI